MMRHEDLKFLGTRAKKHAYYRKDPERFFHKDYDQETHCYVCGSLGVPNGKIKTAQTSGRKYKIVWTCPNGCIEKIEWINDNEKENETKCD